MKQKISNFTDLNLSAPLLKALVEMKYEQPSPIQAQTIPVLLERRDVIGQAQTGTGKTAAFAIPILQELNADSRATQALTVAPTRELAIQVAEQFKLLATHLPGIEIAVLCGGQDYTRQLKQLRFGAQIVVGTPGRILDHIERKTLKLDQLKTFVLDEADEMLRMGFIDDVEMILSKLPKEKQMALFSATMPTRIRHIATRYLTDPVSIEIRAETATVKSTEQRFLFASVAQKPDALARILAVEAYQGVIVFVRTKSSSEEVAEFLQGQGLRAMAIHGDLSQSLREKIIAQFRQGSIEILVATDVAARGLDVDRVTHVINYDVPHDCETYVHRIGRTGRAGRSGVTILFVTPKESRILNTIERHTRQRIEKIITPSDHMIEQARAQRFVADIQQRLCNPHLLGYRQIIEEFLKTHPEASPMDVAAAIALILNQDKPWQRESLPKSRSRFVDNNPNARERDFSIRSDRPWSRGSGSRQTRDVGEQALFRLDVGRMHGVKPGNIIGAIANEAGLSSQYITQLKIHEDYSTVKLPKGMSKEMFQDLNKAWVCGRQLKPTLV